MQAWPAFVVGKVGTDLHHAFRPGGCEKLRAITAPHGSLVKGHYTDWVDNPEAYPTSGMGGANVGPGSRRRRRRPCGRSATTRRPSLAPGRSLPRGSSRRSPMPSTGLAAGASGCSLTSRKSSRS